MASTTLPFADRQNAGILATAMNLNENIFADRQNAGILATAMNLNENIVTADFTSSLKAGTSALVTALGVIRGGSQKSMLVVASDSREARPASAHEMLFGDGAAAVLVGTEVWRWRCGSPGRHGGRVG
ncbi:MAG: hypothetical protein MUC98_15225 [Desulfobacterota bacterium]|nr:hypothetical protein [Thermodesulfobacteriota bacterium]